MLLGCSWDALGMLLGALAVLLGALVVLLGALGVLLVCSWDVLGLLLECSWGGMVSTCSNNDPNMLTTNVSLCSKNIFACSWDKS